jgi:pyruvate/2-oxoglutarate dehydrogenase complex dihydrolipoamide acyltransferase (E2) component
MVTAIRMPDIGTTVDRVTLVSWLVKRGDGVKRGDPLCEVETDKAVSELESVAEGVVLDLSVEAGAEIEQGTIIAYVGQPGEATAAPAEPTAPAAPGAEAARSIPPLVRNLARKEGVDLGLVTGTGPGGRITREDVLRAKAAPAEPPAAPAGKPLPPSQITIGRRVSRSHREIPPISFMAHIDMANVLRARRDMEKKTGRKPSFDAFFVKAAAGAMRRFPHFRSRFERDSAIEREAVDVGVAIDRDGRLFIPVVRGADAKTLAGIDADIRALAAEAGSGTLAADALSGATLTVTNLGMFPVTAFQAIIPPDQAAVLSVGAVEDRAVVRQGAVTAAPMATVTLTVDHRLVNGREAAEFVTELKKALENVESMAP